MTKNKSRTVEMAQVDARAQILNAAILRGCRVTLLVNRSNEEAAREMVAGFSIDTRALVTVLRDRESV